MVNYYALLKLEEAANENIIRQAIRQERRSWNQRSNHPKQEIRAEAEQKIKEIAEAEKILLDSGKRAAYNQELINAVPEYSASKQEAPTGERNWLNTTLEYISNGDYTAAAYASKEATSHQATNAEAWYWRGVASTHLNDVHDADFSFHEAIRLNPNDASYYVDLGDLYRTNEDFPEALKYYRQAYKLDGNNAYIMSCLGACLLDVDAKEAFSFIERAYALDAHNDFTNLVYSIAICATIEDAWSGGTTIANLRQLNYTKEQLRKLQSFNIDDDETRQSIREIQEIINEAEEVKFRGLRYGSLAGWEYNARKLPAVLLRTGLQ